METFIANLAISRVQRRTVGGKDYLVAPLSLIVPGVLNGSKGALYYPPEEVAKCVDKWNGMPLVLYHPVIDGQNVSAKHPGVIEKSGLGVVKNARLGKNGRLIAEGWFDAKRTQLVDSRVYSSLTSGNPIELSTGLFTDNTPAPWGATHNGRMYQHIARNYRPDHLAILPDQIGACSINDGCGVLVNKENNIDTAQFAKTLKKLTTNTIFMPRGEREFVMNQLETNSNPQGINQYTHAKSSAQAQSYRANQKSVKANSGVTHLGHEPPHRNALKSSEAGDHEKAAHYHSLAVSFHSRRVASGEDKSGKHAQAVEEHTTAAAMHREAAKLKTTNNEEMVDNGGPGSGPHKGGYSLVHDTTGKKIWKHTESGHEVHLSTSTIYKKSGHQRDTTKTKQVAVVSTTNPDFGKFLTAPPTLEHKAFSKVGEGHDVADALKKSVAKHLNQHFGIVHNQKESEMTDNTEKQSLWQKLGEMLGITTNGGPGSGPHPGGGKFQVISGKFTRGVKASEMRDHFLAKIGASGVSAPAHQNKLKILGESVDRGGLANGVKGQLGLHSKSEHLIDAAKAYIAARGFTAKTEKIGKGTYHSDEHGNQISIHPQKPGSALSHSVYFHEAKKPTTNEEEPDNVSLSLSQEERETVINTLVANCSCQDNVFDENDKKVLNQFSDETLRELVANSKKKPKEPELDGDDKEPDADQDDSKLTDNKENEMADGEKKPEAPAPLTQEAVLNALKGLTREQFMSIAPKDVQEAVVNSENIVNKHKADLILQLTANVKDEAVKARQIAIFQEMKPDQLQDILAAIPQPTANAQARSVASYLGAQGAPAAQVLTRNADADKKTIEEMTPPKIDYKELAANSRRN